MISRSEILAILSRKKEELQRNYPISELALFGSYARGDNKEDSDIDILIDFYDSIDGFQYIRIAHELEDAFNKKIDLVSRKGLKKEYLPYIEKNLVHV